MKNKTYYLHTINGKPAVYVQGKQIYYATFYGLPNTLAVSLKQIRSEQKLTKLWRIKKGHDISRNDYGHIRVEVPDAKGETK